MSEDKCRLAGNELQSSIIPLLEDIKEDVGVLKRDVKDLSRFPIDLEYTNRKMDESIRIQAENTESLKQHMARTAANEARLQLVEQLVLEQAKNSDKKAEIKGYIVGAIAILTLLAAIGGVFLLF